MRRRLVDAWRALEKSFMNHGIDSAPHDALQDLMRSTALCHLIKLEYLTLSFSGISGHIVQTHHSVPT